MLTDKIKQLEILKAKTSALEQQLAAEQNKKLATLPSQFGFKSTEEFIEAVRAATGGRRGRVSGATKSVSSVAKVGRRRRAVITDETRAQVKKLVEGGKTGEEIAKAVGISLPSVQNIKKALGLVQKRKK